MGYIVDRVVICDAYAEPQAHYRLLAGGRSKGVSGRRPWMRYLASGKDVKGGIGGVVGKEASLFEDMLVSLEQQNGFVNGLREEVRNWRVAAYPGTALVTRRLLEWWFERDEERKAEGKRFFFCQQEAVETVIYLYEVQKRRKMPETGDLIRYALKLATGTGKTVVMALLIVWSTLHKRKVSGSSLSANFLVMVPNLTVRDRVSGVPRGDGLDPAGAENLYAAFDMVPPEYRDEFHPNILVKNWQAIPLEAQRDDWVPEEIAEEGRFVPASVLWALRRRARQDPNSPVRRVLGGWRDLVVINDEAHHVYGEKHVRKGEDPEYIKWSKILERIGKATRISLVVDLSATPWYGSGSPKPEGTLFEWLVSGFSVYDAFESGLVKVVRLPGEEGGGLVYLDLWDAVKGARTKEEHLSGCKGAIASICASWKEDFQAWGSLLDFARGPSPVMLLVASDATRARWLFEHVTKDYELPRNPDGDDPIVGFPVERRKRPGIHRGTERTWIEKDDAKRKHRIRVPNVRSRAAGVTQPLGEIIRVRELPGVVITPKETPPEVTVRPVVGGQPEAVMTLEEFREEYPLLKTAFMIAGELLELTSPGTAAAMGIGPTFDELLEVVRDTWNLGSGQSRRVTFAMWESTSGASAS